MAVRERTRAAAAIPFFYWRAGFAKNPDQRPAPVLDLGAPQHGVWTAITGSLTQALAFDPNTALIRSSTRSYRNNARDHRKLHLLEGLAVISQLEDLPSVKAMLSEPELAAIQARLALAGQTFGGLVEDSLRLFGSLQKVADLRCGRDLEVQALSEEQR